MRHFINLKDISATDLRKILKDAKKRKSLRKNLDNLDIDKGAPLKGLQKASKCLKQPLKRP